MASEDHHGFAAPLYCIVVTFRRAEGLALVLDALGEQTVRPHCLVVDCEDSSAARDVVNSRAGVVLEIDYLCPGENLGPAGGTALGMDWILQRAGDDAWIARCDDDRPPPFDDLFERLLAFGNSQRAADASVAGVATSGALYNWKRGRLERVPDSLLVGAVDVDYLPTNCFPLFSVGAVRRSGTLDPRLFYGFSEVEYGLRLRAAGHRLLADSESWRRIGRLSSSSAGARASLRAHDWRRYYKLRNEIYVLSTSGHRLTAMKVALVRGLAKPVANLVVEPRQASAHLKSNVRAIVDGFMGRLGRRVFPE